MWLRDALPEYITPEHSKTSIARVVIYGYRSPVSNSTSAQSIPDLATAFMEILSLLDSKKPMVLLGHSLGGIIIKEVGFLLFGLEWMLIFYV